MFAPSQELKSTNIFDTSVSREESESNEFEIRNVFQSTQADTKQIVVKNMGEEMSDHVIDEGIFAEPFVHMVSGKSQTSSLYSGHIVPSTFIQDYTNHSEERRSENYEQQHKNNILFPLVLLENWGPKLEGSSLYCKDCQILFPTSDALQAHNMSEHTFLVPTCNNEPIKSSVKGSSHILYQCKTCDILYDNYDKAVEHSQNHLNDMANNVIIMQCLKCDKKFDSTSINKHRELHIESNKTEDSLILFKIVTFDYTALFKSEWMLMFWAAKVPEKQILSIINRSIYFQYKDIKFKVVKDGPENAVLFKCAKCERHINPSTLTDHMDWCQGESEYICPLNNCGLKFCGTEAPWHSNQHEWSDTFKIVLFNEERDKKFNEILKWHSAKAKVNPDKKLYYYYQCRKCKCCTDARTDIATHRCCYAVHRILCDKCDLFFAGSKIYKRHKKLHDDGHIDKKMTRMTIYFKPKTFTIPGKSSKKLSYKCGSCGSSFHDKAEFTKHMLICRSVGQKARHNNLYHCKNCSLNFMLLEDLENHVASGDYCGSHVTKYKCRICGLLFTKETLQRHNEMHHNQMKLTSTHLNVIKTKLDLFNTAKDKEVDSRVLMKGILGDILDQSPVQNKSNDIPTGKTEESVLNNDLFSNTLYKCDSCSTHFLTADILEWHIRNSKHDVAKSNCTFCEYDFTVNDLPTHIFIHHDQMGSKRDNFDIISNSEATNSANIFQDMKCLESNMEIFNTVQPTSENS
ncbi:zinc finger protein 91-like [Pectinophora gossypiella]|uniref:zinc finger protein 91-like n=1 Tax=Pectinophora gossypiella TaxID=13191 RepID=UPI00214EE5D9|nr:zinc finger protein 91-like [Pectinophora gossypiella]XP_049882162.1 zinc finger protein 91-like [Pectinophora gossypiella]